MEGSSVSNWNNFCYTNNFNYSNKDMLYSYLDISINFVCSSFDTNTNGYNNNLFYDYCYRSIADVIPYQKMKCNVLKYYIVAYLLSQINTTSVNNDYKTVCIIWAELLLCNAFNDINAILHICAELSESDITLRQSVKFKTLSRPVRKIILHSINNLYNSYKLITVQKDCKKYKKLWIMLGEKLHPGDYSVFALANTFFNIMRF